MGASDSCKYAETLAVEEANRTIEDPQQRQQVGLFFIQKKLAGGVQRLCRGLVASWLPLGKGLSPLGRQATRAYGRATRAAQKQDRLLFIRLLHAGHECAGLLSGAALHPRLTGGG